jgi:tRNA G18 (ribose-2'-O)-methylase SpoU
MPIDITDLADPALRDYVGLTDVALRRRVEPERGLFIAESEKVIRRALAAGYAARSFLMERRWVEDLADVVAAAEAHGIPVYAADRATLEALTGFHLHRGALAAMHRRDLPPLAEVLEQARRVFVLEDIVDHTNVGAIFRSAAALGVDAVLVTPRCADPLYRRAIRVSMGTVFQVPWTRIDPWPGTLEALRDQGFVTAALALTPTAVRLDSLADDPPERLAFVLGTEGDGLSGRAMSAVDLAVRIPMCGGVDSLNVAAAAAVAAWALRVRETSPRYSPPGAARSRSAGAAAGSPSMSWRRWGSDRLPASGAAGQGGR